MTKLYRLLTTHITIVLVLTVLQSGAQNLHSLSSSSIVNSSINKGPSQKSLGDTLYYEDFGDSTLSNWTVIDSSNSGHNWIWSKSAPGGQYSTSVPPLNSPTSSNGYLLLPADLYNTPWNPAFSIDTMDAWISSGAIPITPSQGVQIEYRHFLRLCCKPGSYPGIEMQVSSDSLNWIPYKASICNSARSGSALENRIHDVSHVLAWKDTAYIRFRFSNFTHYQWMIDDLVIRSTLGEGFQIITSEFDPFPSSTYEGNYTKVSTSASCLYTFRTAFDYVGFSDQTNVRLEADVFMDSTIGGGAGAGLVSNLFSNPVPINSRYSNCLGWEEMELNFNATLSPGHYKALLRITSDSIPLPNSLGRDTLYFTISSLQDSTIARDQGVFMSTTGINSNDFSVGVIMNTQDATSPNTNIVAKSVSIYISRDSSNIGLHLAPFIRPVIIDTTRWGSPFYRPDSVTLVTNTNTFTIQANMLDSWVVVPFSANSQSLPLDLVLVGVEQTPISTVGNLRLGVDQSSTLYPYFGRPHAFIRSSSNGTWINPWTMGVPGIRLNFIRTSSPVACSPVGFKEQISKNREFLLFPNPSNGLINFQGDFDFDQIEVLDLNGRLVHQEGWNQNDRSIDLSFLEEGLYFLRLRGEVDRVEKVVIQH